MASEINTALMDPATAKWLVSEYGVSESAAEAGASLALKSTRWWSEHASAEGR